MTAPGTVGQVDRGDPGFVLRCPGVDEYGHGLTAAQIHAGGCCERFTAQPADVQDRTGLRIPENGPGPKPVNRTVG